MTIQLPKTFKTKRRLVLSMGADAKTVKGQKLGFLTGILYMAPSNLSGYQVCALAKLAGCEKPCLNLAGRGVFNSVQVARINKTKRYFEDHDNFLLDIIHSIKTLERKALRLGLTPLVRLNGTSDICYENVIIANTGGKNIFELFPHLSFYDYTKHPCRKNIPFNYDLTFSYSGVETFKNITAKALLNTKLSRIAVVFDKAENIPSEFMGRPVLSGDNSDVRHLDAIGSIIALYAKGKAKSDFTGFVVRS